MQASSFNALHLEQQIRGAVTHLQCPAQQSPEHPKYILPPSPTILPCQHQALDLPHLWRGTDGVQDTDKTKTCKNSHSQFPTECFGQRTWLARVCSDLSKQRAPQMLPCQSRDALFPKKAPLSPQAGSLLSPAPQTCRALCNTQGARSTAVHPGTLQQPHSALPAERRLVVQLGERRVTWP